MPHLVANRLHGPLRLSGLYALSWHGMIPERMHELTSICMRRGRVLDNALGRFSYTKVPEELFPIGIRQEMRGRYRLQVNTQRPQYLDQGGKARLSIWRSFDSAALRSG